MKAAWVARKVAISKRATSHASRALKAHPDPPFATPMDDLATLLRKRLVPWFDENKRSMPWRQTKDPYAIWVSEIMLQQTRVATVIEYFERWMADFPTVDVLAAAGRDEVMSVWAGLGYYRRARMLHDAAAVVVHDHQGSLPENMTELRALPGIGDYTAGAIASIAFGEKVPAIDGNVIRVISRLLALEEDPTRGKAAKQLKDFATRAVDPDRPGDFNQSLMELGATICTPRNPDCASCPLEDLCQARHLDPEDFPVRPQKKAPTRLTLTTALVYNERGEYILRQRPPDGLWGGLWEFPTVPSDQRESLLRDFQMERPRKIGRIEHQLTHRNVEIEVLIAATAVEFNEEGEDGIWLNPDQWDTLPFSVATRKVIQLWEAL